MKYRYELIISTKYNVSKIDIYSAIKDVYSTAKITVLDIIPESIGEVSHVDKKNGYDRICIAERKRALQENNAVQIGRKTKCLLVDSNPHNCFRCPYKDCIDNYISISPTENEMNRAFIREITK